MASFSGSGFQSMSAIADYLGCGVHDLKEKKLNPKKQSKEN